MSIKRFIVEELESFIEGTGDAYAQSKFGIPDPGQEFEDKWQKQVKSQAPTTPEDGELVGKIISNGALVSNIFKNPRTMKNFEPDVRAISDKDENLYVAQIDGPFYHEVISNALKQYGIWLGSAYNYKENIQWHRVDATNTLGYSISFSTYAQVNQEDTVRRIDDLQKKFSSLDFANDYHEDLKEGGFQMEGTGDKYQARRNPQLPDAGAEFERQWDQHQKSQSQNDQNGELIGTIENVGTNVYKNPKSLANFEEDVRAISDSEGNLYVAQLDKNLQHNNIGDVMNKHTGIYADIYDREKFIQWHRVGTENKFGYSVSFENYFETLQASQHEDTRFNIIIQRFKLVNQKQPYEMIPFHWNRYKNNGVDWTKSRELVKQMGMVDHKFDIKEGTGDKYAADKFGIPDPDDSYDQQTAGAISNSEMGELVGKISDDDNTEFINVYKNPKSLKNFHEDVRAVSDAQGNLYVAQTYGEFSHGGFSEVLKFNVYRGSNAVTWDRIGNSDSFGYADSYMRDYGYMQGKLRYRVRADSKDAERNLEVVQGKNPQFKFIPKMSYTIDKDGNEKEIPEFNINDMLEGTGDKYAEKKWGIPDADKQYAAKGVPDANMGEKIVEIWASSFGGEKENHGWIYKNPRTLKGFDNNVRAVATPDGDLYVAQQDGLFVHADIELSLEKKLGGLDDTIELHRVGSTNSFGGSDTLMLKIQYNNFDPSEYIKILKNRHPQYQFSQDYYQDLREGTGDKYAAQFGVPDQGQEFEDRYQKHLKTQSQSIENGEAVGAINLEKGSGEPDVIVYKNPRSLRNFDHNVRAVSDIDGNVYVAQLDKDFYHNHISIALRVKGINIGDAYSRDKNITWHRIYNTNMFGLSVSFINDYRMYMTGTDGEKQEIENRLRKVNQVNPTLKFVPAYWYDLSIGDISDEEINMLMKPFGK